MFARKPDLLVVTTTWWPSIAIVASSLEQAGFGVTVLCPPGHLAWHADRYRCLRLDRSRPMRSMTEAIALVQPALIVPGDERAVFYLLDLHERDSSLRDRIVRSLGPATSFDALISRMALSAAGAKAGMPVPPSREIRSLPELDRWTATVPGPWVVKVDGAWGGEGVRIAKTREEARKAFATLARGLPFAMALKKRVLNGDPFWLQDRRLDQPRRISVQQFIHGRPGNCVLFALGGTLLGATVVEAETCSSDMGPSTLVRVVERPSFLAGAERLVQSLGLSGFFGLDFMVEDETDTAYLIEMNPRITPPCRIRNRSRTDPITAAARALACSNPAWEARPARDLFASFPLAWQVNPFDPALKLCQADVPWHEPELVEAALKPTWTESGLLARLPSRFRTLKQALATGTRSTDYRLKPLSWWVTEGLLSPSLPGLTHRDIPQVRAFAPADRDQSALDEPEHAFQSMAQEQWSNLSPTGP